MQGLGVLLNTGGGVFSTTAVLTSTYSSNTAPTTAFVPAVLSTADLNGDNKPDLVVNAPGTAIVNFQRCKTLLQVYVGNGDGTFKAPTTLTTADQYGLPVVADFNKDGKMDLAWLAETSAGQAELVVASGNGDGTFGTPAVLNLTGGDSIRNSALVGGDFDGDGNADLVLFDGSDYSGVFYGKGNGTFASSPRLRLHRTQGSDQRGSRRASCRGRPEQGRQAGYPGGPDGAAERVWYGSGDSGDDDAGADAGFRDGDCAGRDA